MNDAFFKTAARAPAFGFRGGPHDRVSERRDDDADVAALRARPDARAVLIARDMPILPRGATGVLPLQTTLHPAACKSGRRGVIPAGPSIARR